MYKSKRNAIFTIMLLMLVSFIPMVSAQIEISSDSSNVEQVTIELNQKDGVLIIPTDEKYIADLSRTATTEKLAGAYFSGTIDENNLVTLEGVITIDGNKEKVQLSGEATQVFIGWDVPDGAKPIYTKVGNRTMTRYEGATEMYATFVDLQDKEGIYNLHGEFYEDGHGGFVGTNIIDGKECQIGLRGDSISMYENVQPAVTTKSTSKFLTVPQRSQWEIYWDGYGYTPASQACGETSAAMLDEYWTGTHPSIWSIWVFNGCDPMNANEAQDYLDYQGVYLTRGLKTGSFYDTIDEIESMIDDGRPFYLTEESRWGTCHAVVLRGYYDSTLDPYFKLNDPNTVNGENTMYWLNTDDTTFNYEENVYEYTGSTDTSSTGYSYLG